MLHIEAVEKLLEIQPIKDTLRERVLLVEEEIEQCPSKRVNKDYVESATIFVMENHRPLYETCFMFPGNKNLKLTDKHIEILNRDIEFQNIDTIRDDRNSVKFRLYEDYENRKDYLELSFDFKEN